MRNLMWVWLAAGALALGGCATKKPVQKPAAETTQGAGAGATSQGAPGEGVTTAPLGDDTASAGPQGELLSKRIIYFEFDRAEFKPEDAAAAGHLHLEALVGGLGGHLGGKELPMQLRLGPALLAGAGQHRIHEALRTADREMGTGLGRGQAGSDVEALPGGAIVEV